MNEPDPLDTLVREWKAPELPPGMDRRIAEAYLTSFRSRERRGWRGFWSARVSVPVPVLVAAMVVFALLAWYRFSASTSMSSNGQEDAAGVVTRLNAAGFQPLPNGEARIVPVKEISR